MNGVCRLREDVNRSITMVCVAMKGSKKHGDAVVGGREGEFLVLTGCGGLVCLGENYVRAVTTFRCFL